MTRKAFPFVVIARLPYAHESAERVAVEGPFAAALADHDAGRVTGGGTESDEPSESGVVEIDLVLKDLGAALEFARRTLAGLGTPAGSCLQFIRDGQLRELPLAAGSRETAGSGTAAALTRRLDRAVTRNQAAVRLSAGKILASYEQLWAAPPEDVPVDLSGHDDHEGLAWCDTIEAYWTAAGFRVVGNFTTAGGRSSKPGSTAPAFARKFLAADGRTRATAFRVRGAARGRPSIGVLAMTSEFDDGTFVHTNNLAPKWNLPDCVIAEHVDPEVRPSTLAARHQARMDAHLHEHPAARLVLLRNAGDLLASEGRMRAVTGEFRRSQAVPSLEELRRLGAEPGFALRVREAMQQLRAPAV